MTAAMLTVAEAADRLKATERYVLDELRRKNLRGTKLNGKAGWRVSDDDLQRYIDARANLSKVRGRS